MPFVAVKSRFLIPLAGLGAAALGFTALLYVFAAAFRPDVVTPPRAVPAAALAAVEAARARVQQLGDAPPPVITRTVDYTLGERAPWWPRREAPALQALVGEGRLPPVAARVGPEPVVIEGVEGVGTGQVA